MNRRVLGLSEVEREAELAQRLDRISSAAFRDQVRRGARDKEQSKKNVDSDSDDDDESGAKRSSRSRKAVGTTSERAKGLNKLKAKRQEKGKKKGPQVTVTSVAQSLGSRADPPSLQTGLGRRRRWLLTSLPPGVGRLQRQRGRASGPCTHRQVGQEAGRAGRSASAQGYDDHSRQIGRVLRCSLVR